VAQFTSCIDPKDLGKMPEEHRELLTRLLTIQADREIGLDMFGRSNSARDERHFEWGLAMHTTGKIREDHIAEIDPKITALGLRAPDTLEGRTYR
jgi:1,2-phenylacetyl-CoA epoxidase catalytic subunit